jgi:hypothetical protein
MCRILERPDLASRMRVFHAHAIDPVTATLPLDVSFLSQGDWARVSIAVEAASRSENEAKEWVREMGALLLTLFPNLEEFVFENRDYSNGSYPLLMILLSRATQIQNDPGKSGLSLNNLRSVALESHHAEIDAGIHPHAVIQFPKLGSVRTFQGRIVSDAWLYECW